MQKKLLQYSVSQIVLQLRKLFNSPKAELAERWLNIFSAGIAIALAVSKCWHMI